MESSASISLLLINIIYIIARDHKVNFQIVKNKFWPVFNLYNFEFKFQKACHFITSFSPQS